MARPLRCLAPVCHSAILVSSFEVHCVGVVHWSCCWGVCRTALSLSNSNLNGTIPALAGLSVLL